MRPQLTAIASPLGVLDVWCTEAGVAALLYEDHAPAIRERILRRMDTPIKVPSYAARFDVAAILGEYFAGDLRAPASLVLDLQGTRLQRSIWQALRQLPPGRTRSYTQLAVQQGLGPPGARVVGRAVACNPVCVAVPCHRVVGKRGRLMGYAGGLRRKRWLLHHEAGQLGLPLRRSS